MFNNFRKSLYFSGVTVKCRDIFAVDILKADKEYGGIFIDLSNDIWTYGRSKEEAAVVCLTHLLRLMLDEYKNDPAFSPDFAKWARWELIIQGWAAQGLLTVDALEDFRQAVLSCGR